MAKPKTPEYTRRAIQKYMAEKDKATVVFPKGTKDRIKELTGESINSFVNRLVLAELERLENQ